MAFLDGFEKTASRPAQLKKKKAEDMPPQEKPSLGEYVDPKPVNQHNTAEEGF